MISHTEENYLKALYNLASDTGEVAVSELSKQLGIKKPTVTSMMNTLAKKNMVFYESYKPIRLTEEGKKEARIIIRKHRLTEMFLVEKMGFGWENVHEIAEQVEHINSPEFFEKMDDLLGHPRIDPHGSPIPGVNGEMINVKNQKLSDSKVGEEVILSAVVNTSAEFLTFLNQYEIKLGIYIKIVSVEPFDRSMTLSYGDRPSQVLSHTVCERLLVEK